jgi:hypothetical protein
VTKDEAERIAEQIARTIPREVAFVVKVTNANPLRDDRWRVKCDEVFTRRGRRRACFWIETTQEWIGYQQRWTRLSRPINLR